jgi:hypothetical protein
MAWKDLSMAEHCFVRPTPSCNSITLKFQKKYHQASMNVCTKFRTDPSRGKVDTTIFASEARYTLLMGVSFSIKGNGSTDDIKS